MNLHHSVQYQSMFNGHIQQWQWIRRENVILENVDFQAGAQFNENESLLKIGTHFGVDDLELVARYFYLCSNVNLTAW